MAVSVRLQDDDGTSVRLRVAVVDGRAPARLLWERRWWVLGVDGVYRRESA